MTLPDRCENERRKAVRRATPSFILPGTTSVVITPRPCDRKRWEYMRYVWKNYGLTTWDIALKWNEQGGRCPICEAKLETKRWVIEHRHVAGFKKLPPAIRAKYFRGIVCNWCNHRVLSMCERAGKVRIRHVTEYLDWGVWS